MEHAYTTASSCNLICQAAKIRPGAAAYCTLRLCPSPAMHWHALAQCRSKSMQVAACREGGALQPSKCMLCSASSAPLRMPLRRPLPAFTPPVVLERVQRILFLTSLAAERTMSVPLLKGHAWLMPCATPEMGGGLLFMRVWACAVVRSYICTNTQAHTHTYTRRRPAYQQACSRSLQCHTSCPPALHQQHFAPVCLRSCAERALFSSPSTLPSQLQDRLIPDRALHHQAPARGQGGISRLCAHVLVHVCVQQTAAHPPTM